MEIDDIYPLSGGQNWVFDKVQQGTNTFFVQELNRVTLELKLSVRMRWA